ncbi:hypothetical protein V7P28_05930, partial [Klebsiella michiganensis]
KCLHTDARNKDEYAISDWPRRGGKSTVGALLPQSDKEEMLKAELLQIQQSFKSVNNTLHLV